jgi:hypothetical protein
MSMFMTVIGETRIPSRDFGGIIGQIARGNKAELDPSNISVISAIPEPS